MFSAPPHHSRRRAKGPRHDHEPSNFGPGPRHPRPGRGRRGLRQEAAGPVVRGHPENVRRPSVRVPERPPLGLERQDDPGGDQAPARGLQGPRHRRRLHPPPSRADHAVPHRGVVLALRLRRRDGQGARAQDLALRREFLSLRLRRRPRPGGHARRGQVRAEDEEVRRSAGEARSGAPGRPASDPDRARERHRQAAAARRPTGRPITSSTSSGPPRPPGTAASPTSTSCARTSPRSSST